MTATVVVGFMLGLLSACFFAIYMVPQKLDKVDHTTYLWVMGFGVFLTAFVAYAMAGFPSQASWLDRGLGTLCGVVWGLGTLAFSHSIGRLGIALATPIKNTTGVFGTLVGLVLFQEWRTTNPWLGTLGSLFIVVSAIAIGQAGDEDTVRRRSVTGIMFALIAAMCYASYLYPLKLTVLKIGYWEFTPWMGLGILITATGAVLLRRGGVQEALRYPTPVYGRALLGGGSWALALFSLAASMQLVDLSVAWSLAQLNTVPAVILGSLFFHEVHFATHRTMLGVGLLAATIGTIFLGMAK